MTRAPDGKPNGDMRGLIAPIGAIAVVGLGFSITLPLLALTLEDRGIPTTWIGINTAVWGIASMAVTPLISRLAVRLGTALLLILSMLTIAVALPLFYFSPFWLWFPLRLVAGATITIVFVLSEFWISTVAPPEKRGIIMGIYATVLSFGFALGPFILTLTGTQGFLPFAVGACVLVAGVLPVLTGLRSAPVLHHEQHGTFWRFLFLAPVATGAALLFGTIESGAFALLPLYGQHVGHARDVVILLGVGITVGNIVLQIPMGLLSDRMDRRKLLLILGLLGLAGAAVIPLVAAMFWPFMILLAIWGGTVGALYTVGLAHLSARFRGADLAAANAAFIFCYSAGGLAGPAIIGASMDHWDPHGFVVAICGFFLAYLAMVLVRMSRAKTVAGIS
ncbi:MFS transporter [Kaistia dalseonensis]|uniref:MFS family permease n=1 Tax=Kaistia dalseonensis TaxID=410840 RepID=A0ABU0H6V3_9HYPH|nr:MFS transporter [Kaistia dalseonensis]MCX5495443.1 MFS transporter [Kaistia dalseonensis]MDQ0438032.1 MFS family permease [Kaistia dalseonensis]